MDLGGSKGAHDRGLVGAQGWIGGGTVASLRRLALRAAKEVVAFDEDGFS